MDSPRGIKRKVEASPERTDGAATSESFKTTESGTMEDIIASIAMGAPPSNAPKLNDCTCTTVDSSPFKDGVDHGNKRCNGGDDENELDEDDEGWGHSDEHDDDDDDDNYEHQDDSMDIDNDYDGISDDEYDDMGPPETEVQEHKHSFGGFEVNFKLFVQDDDDEFSSWMHTIHVHCSSDGKEIGSAFGRFVRRDRITSHFWRDMEEPCQELSSIAFGLFDRYGRLKREFIDHAIQKGSGCWGEEVDLGPLFIIEYVQVERSWRRKGVGKKMVESLIAKASAEKKIPAPSDNSSAEGKVIELLINKTNAKANKLAFTLVSPGWLNGDIRPDLVGKTAREQRDIQFSAHDIAVAFYRSIGFRRIGSSAYFGLSVDPNHSSHKISINDDFNPPDEEVDDEELEARRKAEQEFFSDEIEHLLLMELLEKRLPLHHAALTLPDAECAKHYDDLNKQPGMEEEWKKVDKKFNNLLHIASCEYKPKTVEWLMNNTDVDQTLSSARNINGYTPLEALQAVLETKRTTVDHGMMTICISDNFTGFPAEAVHCIATLKCIKTPSRIQSLRFKFGCTCGQCVDGFFSARMKEALLCEAEMHHDMIDGFNDDGPFWAEIHDHATHHVAPDIRRNFRTNKSLRRGFTNIFAHAADAMRNGSSPRVQNVLDVWKNSGEWPPVTRSYFERGGAAVDALRVMFETARDENHWAGNGWQLNKIFGVDEVEEPAELAALPRCRNDLEFGMVALLCGMPNL